MTHRPARLTRADYTLDAQRLAPALIGCVFVRVLPTGQRLSGRIVETEAYVGARDRACHSFNNRRTARTEPMFGQPGTAYVYFTYGMHHCFNVVCGPAHDPHKPVAVLIRALEPLEGLEAMRQLRAAHASARATARTLTDRDLCRGPGRLCAALGIDRALNAVDLVEHASLFIEPPVNDASTESPKRPRLARSPRVGVDSAGAWALKPLRWFERDHPSVSGPRARDQTSTSRRPP